MDDDVVSVGVPETECNEGGVFLTNWKPKPMFKQNLKWNLTKTILYI